MVYRRPDGFARPPRPRPSGGVALRVSVADNIAYGRDVASEAEIEDAARAATPTVSSAS